MNTKLSRPTTALNITLAIILEYPEHQSIPLLKRLVREFGLKNVIHEADYFLMKDLNPDGMPEQLIDQQMSEGTYLLLQLTLIINTLINQHDRYKKTGPKLYDINKKHLQIYNLSLGERLLVEKVFGLIRK